MKKLIFVIMACFAVISFKPTEDDLRTAIQGTWDLVGTADFGVLSVLSMDDAEVIHYLERRMTEQSGQSVVFKNGKALLYMNGYRVDSGDYEFDVSNGTTALFIAWEEDIEYCYAVVRGNYLYIIPISLDAEGNTNLSLKMTALKYRRTRY